MVQQDPGFRNIYQHENNVERRNAQISKRQQSEPYLRRNSEKKHRNAQNERQMIFPVSLDKEKHLDQENSKDHRDRLLKNQDPKSMINSRHPGIFDPHEAHEKELNRKNRPAGPMHRSEPFLMCKDNAMHHKNMKGRHRAESMVQQYPICESMHKYKNSIKGKHTIIDSTGQESDPTLYHKYEHYFEKFSTGKKMIDPMVQRKTLNFFEKKILCQNDEAFHMQEAIKSAEDILKKVIEDPNKLVPGTYPPVIEAAVIRELKEIAISKTKQGLYRDSYVMLESIINCERATLSRDHPQVANTLYHIGVTLNFMGDSDRALRALGHGIQILYPSRFNTDNMDLAALFYQYSVIEGKRGDYQSALYHLNLAGQVEKHLIGHCTEKVTKKTADYKHAQRLSQKLNQTRSRTA